MCFFFSSRRRHTRWTGDWSSDVCSSDLPQDGDGLADDPECRDAAAQLVGKQVTVGKVKAEVEIEIGGDRALTPWCLHQWRVPPPVLADSHATAGKLPGPI